MGELANREQIASRGIDIEAARLLFGRHAADRRERALRWIDLEAGQGARRALRPVKEFAVRSDVQISRRGLTLEVGWQRADGLLLLELPRIDVVVEDINRSIELADDIHEPAVRMEHKVPWTGLLLYVNRRRCIRRQHTNGRIELKLVDEVVPEGGCQHVAICRIGADRVRVRIVQQHLLWWLHRPRRSD